MKMVRFNGYHSSSRYGERQSYWSVNFSGNFFYSESFNLQLEFSMNYNKYIMSYIDMFSYSWIYFGG